MPDILQYGFMQRAFVAGLTVALIAPLIGIFLVPRRLSLIADALAHVALAGVALALLAGTAPLLGALVVTVGGAVAIERLRGTDRLSGDAALALFLSGGLAVAVVVIGLAGGFSLDLFSYLFGGVTTVAPGDLWLILPLGLLVLGTVSFLYKELFAITFDEESARVQGVPVDRLNLLLTVLVAVTVVVAMRVVGVLLTGALIVIPAVTALRAAPNFRAALTVAVACSLSATVAGITVAFYLNLPASGAIVLSAIALLAGVSLAFPRR